MTLECWRPAGAPLRVARLCSRRWRPADPGADRRTNGEDTQDVIVPGRSHPAGVRNRRAILAGVAVIAALALGAPAASAQVSFTGPTNFAAAGSTPFSVAVGDLDGDGHPDLAIAIADLANFGSGNVSVLLGDGTGGFGAATNFAAGDFPASVAVGDLNGDGHPDLAVTNDFSGNVSVLLNAAAVSGTVFSDTDGNGRRDSGEPGLGGVRVFADLDADGPPSAGEPSTLTAPDGTYRLEGITGASFRIRATPPTGYRCTAPPGCAYDETATGTEAKGRDFADQPPPTPGPHPSSTPILSGLRILPNAFLPVGAARTATLARHDRRPHGATVRYRDTQAATTTLRIARRLSGRRIHGACRAPTRKTRHTKPCTRWLVLRGTLTHHDRAGTNHLTLTGRLRGRALTPGTYRLAATPHARGKTGRTVRATFHILR